MKQALNFAWRFTPDYKEEYLNSSLKKYTEVNIPHTAKEIPYNYFDEKEYQMVCTYEKTFDVEFDIKDRVVVLRFEGFMLKADIYLNDNYLGKYVSGYIPVEIDVSKYLKQKGNRLVVVLDTHEDKNYPPFGLVVDYLTFSGIYREVSLISHPKTYLKNIFVFGDMHGNTRIKYEKVGNKEATISHELLTYPGRQKVCEFKGNHHKLENPKLWDTNNPELYILKTTISSEDGEESYETRFGYRSAEFRKHGFFLNDKHIKIVGLNRHQGYPVVGYAMPKGAQVDDANIMKFELGLNAVRTSHYPQSQHFLNRCDEIGLLVVNEIPGWQHIIHDDAWINQTLLNTKTMVIEQRNHPSVICHGVRIDESIDDHELYEKTNKIAHEFDPYRQTIGVRNFENSELLEDIYGYNDFSCENLELGLRKPSSVKTNGKPYLITEYMGHMEPVKATSDERQRIETALRHMKVLDDSLKYERVSGTIGWCFVDYHTHYDFGSGDRICAHGVMDLYRNPKYTHAVYASQQEEKPVLEVIHNMYPGDQAGAIFNKIYAITNCDYVELYKNGEFVDAFYPKNDKTFKYLKHPPILIDDIVGVTFNETKVPKGHWKKVAKCFSYASMNGFNHLKTKQSLYLGYMMIRYHIKWNDLVGYWNKYVATWGGEAKVYTFKGFKNGQEVALCEKGPSTKFDLRVLPNKTTLTEDETYDVLRVRVQYVDEHGSVMNYAQKIISVSTEGPIKVIGDKHIPLLGGQMGFYIASYGEKGKAKIKISLENIVKEIEVEVI